MAYPHAPQPARKKACGADAATFKPLDLRRHQFLSQVQRQSMKTAALFAPHNGSIVPQVE
ncbi:hypothetical protein I79_005400 [Cricetulus griseus]|uniref:Uncharacterized protein n=1 Tax=Cricetulus griseus TaxID=10029 RepID=G3H531_CRIGR|nr:hypothetical protein I79_005400 [Cricetulus griseus]